jgi:hypothetical protein
VSGINRRSFLALMSAALTVKPAELVAAKPRVSVDAANPVQANWWRHWTVWDTISIEPNQLTDTSSFFPPLPSNFLIESIHFAVHEKCAYDDLTKVFDAALVRVHSDGALFVEAPLSSFVGPDGLMTAGERRLIHPLLRPRDNFRVALNAAALPLANPCRVTIALDGMVRFDPAASE